ncbi:MULTISPECIES: hypothetical protein [unclassified Chryseobacterium]|uniref:hypothetical protein n=1 Tax=unclassified Chryseobacterium TaxID=2593645 RepID=UPI000D3C0C33|nr:MULTISPECIES: hypothetical protein [unclassified Chryseobacterium]PTT72590.1 hypothetical protein DBR25_14305 [Chryseobacterium sp. HMWF001]PVV50411.1 hypothetical protein DD829_22365 [Chryseobacterium sp. HMWF035]
MKKNFQQEFLHSLNDSYDFYLNYKVKREELIANFSRLENSVPFSERLNRWIENWYEQHKDIFVFTDTDDFDSNDIKGTLQRYIEHFKATGKIKIWTGSSENTIFGSERINHFYRAWHDHTHIIFGSGFTLAGETITAEIQCSMLPIEWFFEKRLIMADIVAQNLHYIFHKNYVKDQRKFIVDYLKDPKTIFIKK